MAASLVLGYHALSERWNETFVVRPSRFVDQIRHLARRGYRGVTFSEFVASAGSSDSKLVAITFDDAFRSVLTRAEPILREGGFPATLFVPTAFPGSGPLRWVGIERELDGRLRDELEPLSWQEIARLADSGWEIGAHTRTHPDLRMVDDATLREELDGSKRELEDQLGRACSTMAYPYGYHDDRVVEAAREAGYKAATTQFGGRVADDPLRWPRMGVYNHDHLPRFAFKISPIGPTFGRGLARMR